MAIAKKAKKEAPVLKEAFYDVIERPVITEKATAISEQNKVVFRVRNDATKTQIKEAVEALFKVEVVSVNTINVQGKVKVFRGALGQRKDFKKAVVTLAAGQSIDLASGIA
ncbi:MAG TPA: 50S ribosomal protein L23 [Rickettsiales bacterium]|nr:50S ribosomal protein L23 [Rickettsiales bacterium]